MDLEVLLAVQKFRQGFGALFTEFFSNMNWWGSLGTILLVMGVIYWCVNKKYGEYFLLGLCMTRFFYRFLSVTVCEYRPWMKNSRIVPDALAKATATGYSFPSETVMNASSLFGGAVIRRELSKAVRILLFCWFLFIGLSQIFLGLNTPQDILVGAIAGFLMMVLAKNLMDTILEKPHIDIMVAIFGILMAGLVAFYAAVVSYPVDYDASGALLIDGAAVAQEALRALGYTSAFFFGWFMERRFVNFTTDDITLRQRGMRLIEGLSCYYAVSYLLCPVLHHILGPTIGLMLDSFLEMLTIVFLFPLLMCKLEAKQKKKAESEWE